MPEYTGTYFSENNQFQKVTLFSPDILKEGVALYEVLRIFRGIPLFLDDHMGRLQASIRLSGHQYNLSFTVIRYLLKNLIKINAIQEGNVKIVLHFSDHQQPVLYTYFIPHFYPTPDMYQDGVETDLFMAVRNNPNIKLMVPAMRQRISEFIRAENLYDALLVDADETITEGSKTNVFFVKKAVLYTAPGDKVLKGITRQKVFDLCNQLNYKIIERSISIITLHKYEAAFFTGTSPKILPISRIANIQYDVTHPVVKNLMSTYDKLIATCL
ncbi:MAG: aminotransferase class IV family protein [Bacteroidales bacterium]|nr:aminotransferase class IV family protein [Bacteroidales bacterium]